jgi:hypothetical protein
VDDPLDILAALEGHLLTAEEVAATRDFRRLTARNWDKGKETEAALAIAAVFDGFYRALAKIAEAVRKTAAPVPTRS